MGGEAAADPKCPEFGSKRSRPAAQFALTRHHRLRIVVKLIVRRLNRTFSLAAQRPGTKVIAVDHAFAFREPDVIYPTGREIIDYFAELPAEVKDRFEPLLEAAQVRYRRAWQQERTEEERIEVLGEFAAEVFVARASERLHAHAGPFDAFRTAIGLEGGDAELGFWYAHWPYHIAERGRMLNIWHRRIQAHLWGWIDEAENLWYTPDLVPKRWQKTFTAPTGGPNAANRSVVQPSHPMKPERADSADGLARRDGPEPDRLNGIYWHDLEICFTSEERVQLTIAGKSETRNYAEMGFADRRNGRPSMAWRTLRLLAENRGTLRNGREAGAVWPRVEKRIQEIRRQLRELHPAPGDPLPFVEKNEYKGRVSGYEARFHILCAPAYES